LKKTSQISATLPVILAGIVVAAPAFAQADMAGENALSTMQDAVTGNLGLLVGLGMMIMGLLTWVFSGKAAAGILLMIGGAVFTLSPGIFNGVRSMVYGVVDQFSDGNPTTINPSTSY
jgi:hypothetical protein